MHPRFCRPLALLLLPASSAFDPASLGTGSIERYCNQPAYERNSAAWLSDDAEGVPWVDGSDADNMPGTARAQRAIWKHQHPEDCSNKKFIVGMWQRGFGFGGIMLRAVKLMLHAMENDRVFIIEHAQNFRWADSKGCEKEGQFGQWSCYFEQVASSSCIAEAGRLLDEVNWKFPENGLIVGCNEVHPRVSVCMDKEVRRITHPLLSSFRALVQRQPATIEDLGYEETCDMKGIFDAGKRRARRRSMIKRTMEVSWWETQLTRFMFRKPTEHLCRLFDTAASKLVFRPAKKTEAQAAASATAEAEAEAEAKAMAQRVATCADIVAAVAADLGDEAAAEAKVLCTKPDKLSAGEEEQRLLLEQMWDSADADSVGSVQASGGDGADAAAAAAAAAAAVGRYRPPLIHVHVRHTDKFREMKLIPLKEYMAQAEKIRAYTERRAALVKALAAQQQPQPVPVPAPVAVAETIFLSTDSQALLESLLDDEAYAHWNVVYLPEKRHEGGKGDKEGGDGHERGLHTSLNIGGNIDHYAVQVFTNLFFASEAGYFVGTLGSFFGRFIDHLRMTNGRYRSGYVTFNLKLSTAIPGDWSIRKMTKVNVRFINKLENKIQVFWVEQGKQGAENKEHAVGTVAAGVTQVVNSFWDHRFLARIIGGENDGEVVRHVLVGRAATDPMYIDEQGHDTQEVVVEAKDVARTRQASRRVKAHERMQKDQQQRKQKVAAKAKGVAPKQKEADKKADRAAEIEREKERERELELEQQRRRNTAPSGFGKKSKGGGREEL